jgi:hypothetical protein
MANGMANTQPKFNPFLAGHGHMAGKFNALDPAAQAAARQAYKTQGSAAFRGMLNTGPPQQQPAPAYTGLTGGVQPAEITRGQTRVTLQARASGTAGVVVKTVVAIENQANGILQLRLR